MRQLRPAALGLLAALLAPPAPATAAEAEAPLHAWGHRGVDLAFGLARSGEAWYAGAQFAGPFTVGGETLAADGRGDVAILRIDADAPRAAWHLRTPAQAEVRALAAGDDGVVHAAGYFIGSLAGEGAAPVRATGGADGWLASIAPDGTRRLAALGGKGADGIVALAASGGRLWAAGHFEHGAPSSVPKRAPRVLIARGQDAFVAALDAATLAPGPVFQFGGAGAERALAVHPRGDGVVALVAFDRAAGEGDCAVTADGAASALLAIDGDGRCTRAIVLEGPAPGALDSLAVDRAGRTWVGGFLVAGRELRVDGVALPVRAAGSSDALLLRFDPAWRAPEAFVHGGEAPETLRALVPRGDGVAFAATGAGRARFAGQVLELGRAGSWIGWTDDGRTIRAARAVAGDGVVQATALAASGGDGVAVLGVYEGEVRVPAVSPAARGKTDGFLVPRLAPRGD